MVAGNGAHVLHATLRGGRRLPIGVLICFESAFPDMSRVRRRPRRAGDHLPDVGLDVPGQLGAGAARLAQRAARGRDGPAGGAGGADGRLGGLRRPRPGAGLEGRRGPRRGPGDTAAAAGLSPDPVRPAGRLRAVDGRCYCRAGLGIRAGTRGLAGASPTRNGSSASPGPHTLTRQPRTGRPRSCTVCVSGRARRSRSPAGPTVSAISGRPPVSTPPATTAPARRGGPRRRLAAITICAAGRAAGHGLLGRYRQHGRRRRQQPLRWREAEQVRCPQAGHDHARGRQQAGEAGPGHHGHGRPRQAHERDGAGGRATR